ncbi:hypothetical protein CONPUDRAFT_118487 [Coniophora puteana RWD-64-598 SS2]|uniref:ABC transporter domain-containing protein n=1 Tax=Coniophora puteana (strain RWD-64-598) TaxID=741705 RepID=A0A5M3N2F7_CONPW|nr:uncharacterized protein CONPUDRAFT_118487 [Coniophora puteana RWD-64-598 SS2]EIW85570.1 hypothetical protein CONPUDRAFT_118487 [Coniophora puteana RWD-64-598 SS2]
MVSQRTTGRSLTARTSLAIVALALGPLLASAQSCSNYGFQDPSNSSACLCPPGFGGATCAQSACGGTIFDGSSRSLAPASNGGFSNLTASDCSCVDGWTGEGCNVCTSANACSSGSSKIGGSSSSSSDGMSGVGLNETMVCSSSPQVYAAGELSCDVNNPTLQAIYPLQSTLNILRTLNASLSPVSNASGTTLNPQGGSSTSSVFAQLFYAGVEQFYCSASPCTQSQSQSSSSSSSDSSSTNTWTCQNLQCTCITNTSFCGAVPITNLTSTINDLGGTLTIECGTDGTCYFKQSVLQNLFGANGLSMQNCKYGECVTQDVIDTSSSSDSSSGGGGGRQLGGGVIAGLAVVAGLVALGLAGIAWGWIVQRKARKVGAGEETERSGNIAVSWRDVSYFVQPVGGPAFAGLRRRRTRAMGDGGNERTILDNVSGSVEPGQMMAILGPSGAGKTTLVELLAGKHKSGVSSGTIAFPSHTPGTAGESDGAPHIAFVPQHDTLPPMLTVREALAFAAALRLPESLPGAQKRALVEGVIERLGLGAVADTRIGTTSGSGGGGGAGRGISGGEARRVSIGLELVGCPDVLVLDEPTSGLDSVSAMRVVSVLKGVAGDERNPVAVVCSLHQPSSQLYQKFDQIMLLAHGRALYAGRGAFAPLRHFAHVRETQGVPVQPYQEGYNVADYLLEIASDPPVGLFGAAATTTDINATGNSSPSVGNGNRSSGSLCGVKGEKGEDGKGTDEKADGDIEAGVSPAGVRKRVRRRRGKYAATFLTQLEVLCGREWKILRRDKTLFLTHVLVAAVLGVFCGGLYYQTGITIAGFQSRVGCLFFLGALVAFSSLSALYNIVEIRPLFLRERSNSYYSPTAWLLSRFLFDVVPLRIIPTIIVSAVTYWMAGLAHDAAHFFKFLFILVLYTLVMTLFNFLLGTLFYNGGIAILISALSALYQMTYAGFFVHLTSIPPVLRWLQWLCPLKYTLEALSVNEVGSGLMIQDTLQGVPVDVSATLIMELLFGFGVNNYYRDVLVLFAFIVGFAIGVVGVVWLKVRERR